MQVLVEQHYNRLAEVIATLPAKQRPVLVKLAGTSSKPGRVRNEILQGLADGSTALVVGTKALCSEGVVFKKLGLVIIDEQHKLVVSPPPPGLSPLLMPDFVASCLVPFQHAFFAQGDFSGSRWTPLILLFCS